jgi:isochorismate pyruvate lyase
MINRRSPDQCSSIEEVRSEIDALDREIISLLGKRFLYVKEIVKFKSSRQEVYARDRYNEVIKNRRQLAAENGLSPDLIEKVYALLIGYFIDEEKKILEEKK